VFSPAKIPAVTSLSNPSAPNVNQKINQLSKKVSTEGLDRISAPCMENLRLTARTPLQISGFPANRTTRWYEAKYFLRNQETALVY
jgi:hypothetical protein